MVVEWYCKKKKKKSKSTRKEWWKIGFNGKKHEIFSTGENIQFTK